MAHKLYVLISGKKVNFVYRECFRLALEPEYQVITANERFLRNVSDEWVLIPKRFSGRKIIEVLKQNKNRIIYVCADVFSAPPRKFLDNFFKSRDLFEVTIYPNETARRTYALSTEVHHVIYEVSPQYQSIKPSSCGFDKPRIVYFGAKQNSPAKVPGLSQCLLDEVDVVLETSRFVHYTHNYNMHFSVRKGLDEILFKPTSKILNAAYSECPILLNRYHTPELFPSDYPFFIEDNFTLEQLKVNFFNPTLLQSALDTMARIRNDHGFEQFRRQVRSIVSI
jgi:hypothetical protein